MIESNKKEKIAFEVIKTLYLSFDNIPDYPIFDDKSPFNEAFCNAFHNDSVLNIQHVINSGYGLFGLNTILVKSFYENMAHILSDGEKREYTSKKLGNLQILKTQKDNIINIITNLSNSSDEPNLDNENQLLFINDSTTLVNAIDFSADVFIEDNDRIIAIELKTVKPNSGEMRGEKQKILEGKASLYRKFPNKEVSFFIGFPFDPTSDQDTTYNKTRFLGSIINMTKFFTPDETLIASELWDFLSGESNTMEQILEIINVISTTEFLEKYQFINDCTNRNELRYTKILQEWNLYSELKLINNDNLIRQRIKTDRKLARLYNQKLFDNKGVQYE